MSDTNHQRNITRNSLSSGEERNIDVPATMGSSNASSHSSSISSHLTIEQQRRASIQSIMKDPSLNETERRRSIQNLMDGRRRSSLVNFRTSSIHLGSVEPSDVLSTSEAEEDEPTNTNTQEHLSGGMVSPSFVSKPSEDRQSALKRSHHAESMWDASSLGSNVNSLHSLRIGEIQLNDRTFNVLGNVAYDLEGEPIGDPQKLLEASPKCTHYDRKCAIISPCCGVVFGCRLCHDECDQLNPPIFNLDETIDEEEESQHIPRKIKLQSGPKPSVSRRGSVNSIMSSISEMGDDVHHNIDRFAVKEIICRECFTRQSSKTNECINCKVKFGEYHCDICNLWMSADDKPYHCHECGFCRVGGRDKFRHCKGCGMCIDVNLFEEHNCKSGKYMANCPVCYEDLFSSRMTTHEMPCGHNIHWHCFKSLASHDIRCPICKKTATFEDMSDVWDGLAQDIAEQPLPPELTRCVDVICNDCGTRDENRRWHYLGVQCRKCGTFNTSHNTKMQGVEAHEYLSALEAEHNDDDNIDTN